MSLADHANRLKANSLFNPLFEVKDPIEQYAGITSATNKEFLLCTMRQSESFFQEYLFKAWLEKTNRQLQVPFVYALDTSKRETREVSAKELIEAGFPIDTPIFLHFRFTKGVEPVDGENREGEQKSINVAESIREFSEDPTRVLNEINIWGV